MADGFYLADEKHKSIQGVVVELKGLLYFRQERSGFDGKADKSHVKNYPHLFEEFMKSHPEYVLPASFSPEEVGQASAQEVKALPVEEKLEEAKEGDESL